MLALLIQMAGVLESLAFIDACAGEFCIGNEDCGILSFRMRANMKGTSGEYEEILMEVFGRLRSVKRIGEECGGADIFRLDGRRRGGYVGNAGINVH